MFALPQKEIIVNDDTQVRALASTDGTTWVAEVAGTNLLPGTAAHRFSLEGFLTNVPTTALNLLASAVRIRRSVGAAAVGETAGFTVAVVTTGINIYDEIILRTDALDLTPTEYQNKASEKRYQSSKTTGTLATIIQHIADTINADKSARVTALVGRNNTTPLQNDSAKIVLVAKQAGNTVDYLIHKAQAGQTNSISFTKNAVGTTIYYGTVDTVNTVTASATVGLNSYNSLKNVNWSKNFNIDQNINWMPLPGQLYNSYYFEVNGPLADNPGNRQVPNEPHTAARTAYMLYVKQGLTLDTALNELLIDMNV
jgi:hypothetical protein